MGVQIFQIKSTFAQNAAAQKNLKKTNQKIKIKNQTIKKVGYYKKGLSGAQEFESLTFGNVSALNDKEIKKGVGNQQDYSS